MLYASKVFDRIEYVQLFTLLLKKVLCQNQSVKRRWGHCESECVRVSD